MVRRKHSERHIKHVSPSQEVIRGETKSSATKSFMLVSVLKSFWTMRLMAEILHQLFFFEAHNWHVFFIPCEISRHQLYPRISRPVTWGRDFLLLALDDPWGYWNILPWLFVICKRLRRQCFNHVQSHRMHRWYIYLVLCHKYQPFHGVKFTLTQPMANL